MAPMDVICTIDIAFVHHFVATYPPPLSVLVVLATPIKNYLKWRAVKLAIHSIVGE